MPKSRTTTPRTWNTHTHARETEEHDLVRLSHRVFWFASIYCKEEHAGSLDMTRAPRATLRRELRYPTAQSMPRDSLHNELHAPNAQSASCALERAQTSVHGLMHEINGMQATLAVQCMLKLGKNEPGLCNRGRGRRRGRGRVGRGSHGSRHAAAGRGGREGAEEAGRGGAGGGEHSGGAEEDAMLSLRWPDGGLSI